MKLNQVFNGFQFLALTLLVVLDFCKFIIDSSSFEGDRFNACDWAGMNLSINGFC